MRLTNLHEGSGVTVAVFVLVDVLLWRDVTVVVELRRPLAVHKFGSWDHIHKLGGVLFKAFDQELPLLLFALYVPLSFKF